VSYLLQRMESHRGLAILASNSKQSLDAAFTRRIRFIVDFPFPTQVERAGIWQRAFPPMATLRGIDTNRLGRLSLAGGAIRNIAVNASFAAAATSDRVVTMPLVLDAARREYRKMGLPIVSSEFAWDDPSDSATEALASELVGGAV
jgi:ATP-dependent 26S proteasome regulatory subunit